MRKVLTKESLHELRKHCSPHAAKLFRWMLQLGDSMPSWASAVTSSTLPVVSAGVRIKATFRHPDTLIPCRVDVVSREDGKVYVEDVLPCILEKLGIGYEGISFDTLCERNFFQGIRATGVATQGTGIVGPDGKYVVSLSQDHRYSDGIKTSFTSVTSLIGQSFYSLGAALRVYGKVRSSKNGSKSLSAQDKAYYDAMGFSKCSSILDVLVTFQNSSKLGTAMHNALEELCLTGSAAVPAGTVVQWVANICRQVRLGRQLWGVEVSMLDHASNVGGSADLIMCDVSNQMRLHIIDYKRWVKIKWDIPCGSSPPLPLVEAYSKGTQAVLQGACYANLLQRMMRRTAPEKASKIKVSTVGVWALHDQMESATSVFQQQLNPPNASRRQQLG